MYCQQKITLYTVKKKVGQMLLGKSKLGKFCPIIRVFSPNRLQNRKMVTSTSNIIKDSEEEKKTVLWVKFLLNLLSTERAELLEQICSQPIIFMQGFQ